MRGLLWVLVAAPLAAQDIAVAPAQPKRTIEFSGIVLVNGFYNTARVNNSDVPQLADNDPAGIGATGGSIRQTRLGIAIAEPGVLGGDFAGEVDVDFFGGQQPSSGGRTFPLLRLRRATGVITWRHAQLLVGQESPLVAERSPRSLAAIGFPEFAGAGNLWLWIPQLRLGAEFGYTLRLAIHAAVLAPGTGVPQGAFATQPDSAERSGRPYLQGRIRLGWGPPDDPSEIAVGGHTGWLLGRDSTTGDTLLISRAITADARVKLGPAVELIAEAYAGQAVAGLGGGGIGQNVGAQGVPVRSKGGWVQLNLRPQGTGWMWGGGCGLDDPDDADVTAAGRFKNFVCEGHLEWRPRGPMLFGIAYRRLETTYQAATITAGHVNLAAGYRF